ncbi:hypothetical protein [Bacillus cereus]|uniref:hypothetical protein n=1 Tax=Bacillus cereus TaxID=1396 RepID=UPI00254E7F27|nr:hypothetical protein [Bacillus cereus]
MKENVKLAISEAMMANKITEVFAILDKYNIDSGEDYMIIRLFEESEEASKEARERTKRIEQDRKINRLKKKYGYLQDLSDNQIDVFYAHLLYEKNPNDIFNTRYEHLVFECSHKRRIKRQQVKQEQLFSRGLIKNKYDDRTLEEVYSTYAGNYGFGSHTDETYHILSIYEAKHCKVCEHLIECRCK